MYDSIPLLPILALIIALVAAGLLFILLLRLIGPLFGSSFGDFIEVFQKGPAANWHKFAAAYATERTPPADLLKRQTVKVGAVTHKRCVSVGADAIGLYLAPAGIGAMFGQPPLSIPWQELSIAGSEHLYWKHATILSVGRPSKGTITLLPELYARVKPWLVV